MKKTLFEYKDYKSYLVDFIKDMPGEGRGERSKIASLLRCHIAYVSQVLNGNAHLSLEQADVLNHYLKHSSQEADFFLLLVQIARAGTKSLKDHYKKKTEEIISERLMLKNRLEYQKTLSPQVQPIYYSAWYYTAVHFSLAIPSLQTKEALSEYLGLTQEKVSEVLEFLVSSGLAIQKGNRFEMGVTRIHLPSDSPMISKHHTNWRLQALQSLERNDKTELHYSSVVVLEKDQIPLFREALVKAIEEVRKFSKDEGEHEALCSYSIDFFQVGKKKEDFVNNFREIKGVTKNEAAVRTSHTHH